MVEVGKEAGRSTTGLDGHGRVPQPKKRPGGETTTEQEIELVRACGVFSRHHVKEAKGKSPISQLSSGRRGKGKARRKTKSRYVMREEKVRCEVNVIG